MALFANSLRCNGASAAEGRPTVARLASSRQPVTLTGSAAWRKGSARKQCRQPSRQPIRDFLQYYRWYITREIQGKRPIWVKRLRDLSNNLSILEPKFSTCAQHPGRHRMLSIWVVDQSRSFSPGFPTFAVAYFIQK